MISKISPTWAVAGTVMISVVAVGNPEFVIGSVDIDTAPFDGKAVGNPPISTVPVMVLAVP